MDGSTAVWLGLTLAAPVTLVPEIALLRLLHSRRAAWHPLDVLIVALLVGQLCCTLLALCLSATALAKHAGLLLLDDGPLCAALVSFWTAAHTLHAATLTSMAVDRAMTIRWPYKYRLSVRRTQIRYHVVVLAVVSLLVGVAALFAASTTGSNAVTTTTTTTEATVDNSTDVSQVAAAQLNERAGCVFLPYMLDSRFSLFWLCLHGALLLATLSAAFLIVVTSCCSRPTSGSGSDMHTLGNASDGSSATLPLPNLPTLPPPPPPRYTPGPCTATVSPLARNPALMFGSTTSVDSKTYMVHGSTSHLDKPDMLPPLPDWAGPMESAGNGSCCCGASWNRQRHSTVAAVLIVAYLTHHLPLLVLTTLGTYLDWVLPADWPYAPLVLASSLCSALILMAVLVFVDPAVHGWMVDSLRPSSSRHLHLRNAARHRGGVGGQHLHHVRHHQQQHHQQRSPGTSEATTLEQNLAPMKLDDESRYRMSQIYSHEPTEAKFPLTNGSLFVHLMNPPAGEGVRANRRPSRMGVSAYDHRPQQQQQRSHSNSGAAAHIPAPIYPESVKPPLLTFMSRSKILASNSLLKHADSTVSTITTNRSCGGRLAHEPLYNDPTPGLVQSSLDVAALHVPAPLMALTTTAAVASSLCGIPPSSMKFRRQEPIYATLSETLSSCNTLDSLGNTDDELERKEIDVDSDEGSATESAGDDFEFHNIRTSRQTLATPNDSGNGGDSSGNSDNNVVVSGLDDLKPRPRVARSATYRILCNGLDVKCAKRGEETPSVAATSESRHGLVTCVTIQADELDLSSSSSLKRSTKLLTSLSMNDIDIIGQDDDDDRDDGPSQLTVPVRSDSLFSLFIDSSSHQRVSVCGTPAERIRRPPPPPPTSPPPDQQPSFSSAELAKCLAIDGRRRRLPAHRPSLQQLQEHIQEHQQEQQQQAPSGGALHMRKKSINRSRAAMLQRFQQRSASPAHHRRDVAGRVDASNGTRRDHKTASVVSIAALKAALSESPMSSSLYMDNGDVYPAVQQSKTVFVSEYI